MRQELSENKILMNAYSALKLSMTEREMIESLMEGCYLIGNMNGSKETFDMCLKTLNRLSK